MRQALIVSTALFGLSVNTFATPFVGGSIYGGPNQVAVRCQIYNAGTTAIAVKVSQYAIIDENGVSLTLNDDSCRDLPNGLLNSRKSCHIAAPISDASLSHACHFDVPTSTANLRGSIDILDGNSTVLNSLDMR
jgi:hypothetical protein